MADHPPHHRSSLPGSHTFLDTVHPLNPEEQQLLEALVNKRIRIPLWNQLIHHSPSSERADLITRYGILLRTSDQAVDTVAFEKTLMDHIVDTSRTYVKSAIQTVSLLELRDTHLRALRTPSVYTLIASAYPAEFLSHGETPLANTCEYCGERGHYYYNCRLYFCSGCLLPNPGHILTYCPATTHNQSDSNPLRQTNSNSTSPYPGEGAAPSTTSTEDPLTTSPIPGTPHPAGGRTLRRSRPVVLSGVNPPILLRGLEEIHPTNSLSRVWTLGELSSVPSEGSATHQEDNHPLPSHNAVQDNMALDPHLLSRTSTPTSHMSPNRHDPADPMAHRVLDSTLQIPTLPQELGDHGSIPGSPPPYRGDIPPNDPTGPPGAPHHWYQGAMGPFQ